MLDHFKSHGVRLVLLDLGVVTEQNGIGSLLVAVLGAIAQFERERNSERVKDVRHHLKQLGRYAGGKRPYGWRITSDKRLEPEPSEAPALSLILKMAGEQKCSLRRTQAVLAETMGVKMSHMTIGRIIRDARIQSPAA